jgi:2-amino-4-hydroxy-6-hydroxymethyldihydropteridine diphosphokinase
MTTSPAYIALGSNLADPLAQLRQARQGLASLGELVACSSLYRTVPVGGPPGQDDYLNAVVALTPVTNDPEMLLQGLLRLEAAQGRTRCVRWDARTLDLDLLAWGDRVVESPALILPHPQMMVRAFVLAPLCEVAPGWHHPRSSQSACTALRALPRDGIERTTLTWGI